MLENGFPPSLLTFGSSVNRAMSHRAWKQYIRYFHFQHANDRNAHGSFDDHAAMNDKALVESILDM